MDISTTQFETMYQNRNTIHCCRGILSYTFEIYSHHAFITENHFTKKERHWPRRCTIHQNCTPTKIGRGKWAHSCKTDQKQMLGKNGAYEGLGCQ